MKPTFQENGVEIYQGDCREVLRSLPDESVHCVVTSPPYWGLRDYGTASWDGGSADCDHKQELPRFNGPKQTTAQVSGHASKAESNNRTHCAKCGAVRRDQQIGLEDSPVKYIATMREVFAEVRRVLRNDGVMFLNMGDSYFGSWGNYSGQNRGNGTQRSITSGSQVPNPAYEGLERFRPPTAGVRRAKTCDTSDKAPVGSQESDRLCENLCGECLAVYSRTVRNGSSPASTPVASLCEPSRGCTESAPDHLPTSDSALQVGHTGDANQDHSLEPVPLRDGLLVVPESTKSRSFGQPPGGCLHCDNCGACLSVIHSSSRDGSLCARKSGHTNGNNSHQHPLNDHSHSESCGAAYPYSTTPYLKPKDLVGIPWMLAFALREDGWWLRQDIIWSKPNPMPESVTDRCTKAHEYIFLLSKSERYYFNQEAIKTPLKDTSVARLIQDVESQEGSDRVPGKTNGKMKAVKFGGNKQCPDSRLHSGKEWTPKMAGGGTSYKDGHSGYFSPDGEPLCGIMANKKSVWHVTTQGFAEAHFATFPEDLIKPCILAGCVEGGTVLDPFGGSGTTAKVARELHCKAILVELNPDYIQIAARRLSQHVFNFSENRAGGVAPA